MTDVTSRPAFEPRRRTRRKAGPEPVDVHVGGRLRLRRTLRGLGQEALAARLGISFQQVQKYEKGANRLSASRLYQVAGILEVPVSFFFDDLPDDIPAAPTPAPDNTMTRRETLELVRAYYRIRDPRTRARLYDLIKSIARADGADAEVR